MRHDLLPVTLDEKMRRFAEEASEVIKSISKHRRFGAQATDHVTGQSYDNVRDILDELGDLEHAIKDLRQAITPGHPVSGRKSDWIQTFSGRQFWTLDPRAHEIHIEDIAHALSMLCRYNGQCDRFYSVAEHSVLMMREIERPYKAWALLHDAPEAYLADVPRPVKKFLSGYKEAEQIVERVIIERFGLDAVMPARVKEFDDRILMDEVAQNMKIPPAEWDVKFEPLGVKLQFWSPAKAEREFLNAFGQLGIYL